MPAPGVAVPSCRTGVVHDVHDGFSDIAMPVLFSSASTYPSLRMKFPSASNALMLILLLDCDMP